MITTWPARSYPSRAYPDRSWPIVTSAAVSLIVDSIRHAHRLLGWKRTGDGGLWRIVKWRVTRVLGR